MTATSDATVATVARARPGATTEPLRATVARAQVATVARAQVATVTRAQVATVTVTVPRARVATVARAQVATVTHGVTVHLDPRPR
jgi:hypothetical protein